MFVPLNNLATKKALLTEDVLLEVFAYLDAGNSTAPVLVDSLWSHLFLDKIWRKLTTFDPIFRMLFCRTEETGGEVSISTPQIHRTTFIK
jgi:hypothetical protein